MKSNQIKIDSIKAIVYGESGNGKTTLTATCPSPLFIGCEGGELALADYDHIELYETPSDRCARESSPEMPYRGIKSVEDLDAAYDECEGALRAGAFGYQTIVIDSITDLAKVFLARAKLQEKMPMRAYGAMIDTMELVLRKFRDLKGVHVVVIAQQEIRTRTINAEGKQKSAPVGEDLADVASFGPAMPGSKLAATLPYLFDLVLRLGVHRDKSVNGGRYLQTAIDFQYIAKDRSGKLDDEELPSMTHVFAKIQSTNACTCATKTTAEICPCPCHICNPSE